MKKSYVYKITCKITGEFYFGSSFNAKSDWYWGSGRKIKERIAKYGKDNFVKEILGEFDDRVEAHKVENEYIEQFRNDDKCLNQMLNRHFGSFSEETRAKNSVSTCREKNPMYGKHFSDEHRSKLSASLKGLMSGENNPRYGKIVSDNTRAKISAANLGKHRTTETCAKISAALRGKHRTAETRSKISAYQRGKIVSDDTRAKISAALRGKFHGKHWRKNPITGKREWYD